MLIAVVVVAAIVAGFTRARTQSTAVGSGVVVIETNLAYQGGQAAGTGMVLTSSGEILTNNHVIRGATDIKVVVPKTGQSYTAQVVGYDVSHDVALLRASGASNLKIISQGDSGSVNPGQSVQAVGNAGGTGRLSFASGTVTNVNRAITVSDDQGGRESLSGLIETNAAVRPGDSGGPLLNSSGQVIGMDTAASVGNQVAQTTANDGYAIPIHTAMAIAKQIESGNGSGTVHVGGTAFLGVESTANSYSGSGAVISAVVPGSAAEAAGLSPGDQILSVGGHAISSPDDLSQAVLTQKPGASISAVYLDQAGATQTTNLTLTSGPPR
ncbi:MAG TPA: trypsin-like peptidase domain-containing protein [Gaiellales bacterium]|nr:trypsin-like peptidase domain-containing protein [Gaiellales bacterium]